MSAVSERLRALGARLDLFLDRRPGLTGNIVRHGWLVLLVLAALVLAGGAVFAGGRSQQVVYATEDGSIVALEPESGTLTKLYEGDAEHYAVGPGSTGGSRNIAFTILRGDGDELRGSVYTADLARETRALLENAEPGEVFAYPDYAPDREWVMANRFAAGSPPNVTVFTASGATSRLLEPDLPGAVPILGPAWTAERSVHAWRIGPEGAALTAYNFFERRQAVVYETKKQVGPLSYYFDANATLFAERPRDGALEDSRLKLLVGTGKLPITGGEGLGLHDPSPPVPSLDDAIAVVWTDGWKTGLGFVNPDGWVFEKTGIQLETGSRNPRVSNDGRYVATTDASGGELTVRRLSDGGIVRRVRDAQPVDAALDRMRGAGFDIQAEADWLAPSNYSWRSFDDK